jgi:hypothetical protein
VVTDNGKQQLIDLLCEHGAVAAAATLCVGTFRTAGCLNASFELFLIMIVIDLRQQSGNGTCSE